MNSAVKQGLTTFNDYKKCLLENSELMKHICMIRSYKHELYNIVMNKKSLSPHEDKQYILEDGTSTIPWGHYNNNSFNIIQ